MRCWLVERTFDDKGLVRLVYSTPDGSEFVRRERSAAALQNVDVTAATDVSPDQLQPVEEADRRARYAEEVERMAARHDPDEPV